MTVLQTETSLSPTDYDYVAAQKEFAAYEVIAHRHSIKWVSGGPDDTGLANEPKYIDATEGVWDGSDTIYWATMLDNSGGTGIIELRKYVISTGVSSVVSQAGSGVLSAAGSPAQYAARYTHLVKLSMVYSSGVLYFFYPSNNQNLSRCQYTIATNTWSGVANVDTGTSTYPTHTIDLLRYISDTNWFPNTPLDPISSPPEWTATSNSLGNDPKNAGDSLEGTWWEAVGATGSLIVDLSHTGSDILGRDPFPYAQISPNTPYTFTSYTIRAVLATAPKTWTLQGSNDGSAWTTIDTRTNITVWTGNANTYTIASPGSYSWYKIVVTACNGTTLRINSLEVPYDVYSITHIPHTQFWLSAAASPTSVWYTQWDETALCWFLHYSYFSGGVWNEALPATPMPDRPLWIDAVTQSDGSELCVMAVPTPGDISTRSIGNVASTYHQKYSSILAFTMNRQGLAGRVNNDNKPIEIDAVPGDIWGTKFSSVRISVNGSVAYVCASRDWDASYVLYISYDFGKTWTEPKEILPVSPTTLNRIIFAGTQVFYGSNHADMCLQLGGTSAATQLDLTNRVTEDGIQWSQDPIMQLGLSLYDEDNVVSTHDFFSGQYQVVLRVKVGFYPTVNGDASGSPLLVSLPDIIVDSMRITKTASIDTPVNVVSLSGRDMSAMMTDYVVAHEPKIAFSQQIGADTFDDSSKSNYGGLSHSSVQLSPGEFTTHNNSLVYTPPATARTTALVISTLVETGKLWMGDSSISFRLADNTASALGIVFRMQDTTNYYVWYYEPVSDKCYLQYIRQGSAYSIATTAALSWKATITTTTRYLRVRWSMGTISVYRSNDGITWTREFADQNMLMQYEKGIHGYIADISTNNTYSATLDPYGNSSYFYTKFARAAAVFGVPRGDVGIYEL